MKVYRSISQPIRDNISREEIWNSQDLGLIHCWELGRKRAMRNREEAQRAINGELLPLGWKGGITPSLDDFGNEITPKYKFKLGSLKYLAEFSGLIGSDLNLDTEADYVMMCSRFGITVEFTSDIEFLSKDIQVGHSSRSLLAKFRAERNKGKET